MGCGLSPSLSGRLGQQEVMTKINESQMGAQSGVTNVSREWSRETWVVNVGCECESQNVNRKYEPGM